MRSNLAPLLNLVAAVLLLPQASTSEALHVTAVRCWSFSDLTRVAIEVNGEFEYHAERLHNPDRIFFDIFGARPNVEGRRVHNQLVGDKLVERIRVAQTSPRVTRIVFDLTRPADYSASQLANPNRLIIELKPLDQKPSAPAVSTLPSEPPPSIPVQDTPAPGPAVIAKAAKITQPEPPVAEPNHAQLRRTARPAEAPQPGSAAPALPLESSPAPAAAPGSTRAILEGRGMPARPASDGRSSLTRALGLKINRIVIDPGHGGHDQGTIGRRGLREKDLVLDVSKRLAKLIEERMGSEVILTRSDDTFIPLERRTAIANEKRADLFVSLHANSSPQARVAGVETYYLNFSDSQDALEVAARENASSQKSVFELKDLIEKISMHDKVEESRELANRVQTSLFAFSTRYNSGIRNRGVKKAPFVVLIGASMPSILAEIAFLSNSREESLLRRGEHRQKLAEALYRGISRYAQTLSHVQVAEAKD